MSRARPSNSSGSDVSAAPGAAAHAAATRRVDADGVEALLVLAVELDVGDEDRQRDRAQVRDAVERHR